MNIEYKLQNSSVLPWARQNLKDSLALSFSKIIDSIVTWDNATFSVIASDKVSGSDLLNFKTGGKTDASPSQEGWLLNAIDSLPLSGNVRWWLIEDWMARPSDGFIVAQSMPVLYFGDEVYYLMTNPRVEKRRDRVLSNRPPLFHAFILDGVNPIAAGSHIKHSELEEWAKSLRGIIFGVYDAESYLLCSFGS